MNSTRTLVAKGLGPVTVLAVASFGLPAAGHAQQSENVQPFVTEDFSAGLDGWSEQRLDRRSTEFRIAEVDGNPALEARSDNAAAALIFPLALQPASGVRIRWRWRVRSSLVENSLEADKKGDDYAARVFVIFGDPELNSDTRALAYAWAGQQPVGSIYPNPYIAEVATIILRSGNGEAGEWVVEDRHIAADYERAFGGPAPELAAFAVLVDTDDTRSLVVSWFDDFELIRELSP
jgi:hypothetical protein